MEHRNDKAGFLCRCLLIICLSMLPDSTARAASPISGVTPSGVDSPDGFAPGLLGLWYGGVRTFDNNPKENDVQMHELKVEYGVTDSWTPGVWADFIRNADGTVYFKNVTLDSTFQFWEPEEKWLDAALRLQYAHNIHSDTADAVTVKLLLEKQSGKFLHRANIGVQQGIGTYATGGPDPSFQWSSRYLLNDYFRPGFEIQSNLGQDGQISGSIDKQQHFIGPAAYGKITDDVMYRVVYLFGVSGASAQSALRFQLLYLKDF